MKMVRIEVIVYRKAQDNKSIDEVKNDVLDIIKTNGLDIKYSEAELVWDNPDSDLNKTLTH